MNIKKIIYSCITIFFLLNAGQINAQPDGRFSASISLKVPGNNAVNYPLSTNENASFLVSETDIPAVIFREIKDGKIVVTILAKEAIYFNFKQHFHTKTNHAENLFYIPGFWYRHNLRSPKEAPSFHTSDSWTFREDRLSVPMTVVFNEKAGNYFSVMRIDDFKYDALTTHKAGEVIVSGKTSIGYTGFENIGNESAISFGYPYQETPRTYIRKLTLDPSVEAFQHLAKGETIQLTWLVKEGKADDFSDLIKQMWEYSFDTWQPQPVETGFSDAFMKKTLARYYTDSYVDKFPLKFMSGVHLYTHNCTPNGRAEVGFVGRVLLNAFNALEYGKQENHSDLIAISHAILNSYLAHGFTPNGFFREDVHHNSGWEAEQLSIRRQSEGVFAILHFLQYEKNNSRRHPEWEKKITDMLDKFLSLQNEDGSFPRKFYTDMRIADASGGSTPSATLPLVMAYRYFNNQKYLVAAKRSAEYLEREIIQKADYYSSTIDANCEDKEASLYASTAMYYLAFVTTGREQQRYADLSLKAAYFALSWYYMWDVPFAQGQMIGDIGLKTRGWGNVSVENNHIDVFIFEFGSVLQWLSVRYNEPRFIDFLSVINSSMRQLLPFEGHLCGVAKPGFYPEVVQHTNWDYGKNGKGFYNDLFAPGWTIPSLWELLTPGRAEKFLKR